jgi:hypothetical protein
VVVAHNSLTLDASRADAAVMGSPSATAEAADSSGTCSDTNETTADTDQRVSATTAGLHNGLVVAIVYAWVRVALIVSAPPFETPDTESYRSGQATRPWISSELLSVLGDHSYVALSALVSTAGFMALAWALWDPAHRRRSYIIATTIAAVSLLPMVAVYEHWLVPDSLLVGMSLIALSLAWRAVDARWYPWTIGTLCVLITCTKEVGFGVVLLIAMVLVARRSFRLAGALTVICAVLFATAVLPASNRTGQVLWNEPTDIELTMERFRVVVSGLMWSDLSPELTEVGQRSAECGMTMNQLLAETFQLTDKIVSFENCPKLWESVDNLSQIDVLAAHVGNPKYVAPSIERGFAPDMAAMALWSGYRFTQQPLLSLDRIIACLVALLPALALGAAFAFRRGRVVAIIAAVGTSLAFASALVDPSSQDRHTIVFRVVAFALGLMALTEVFTAAASVRDSNAETADVAELEPESPTE